MAEKETKVTEQTDMDKITTEMMEHICHNLCMHPIRVGQTQDELDDICAECKMGKFVCDLLNTYNRQRQQFESEIRDKERLLENKTFHAEIRCDNFQKKHCEY